MAQISGKNSEPFWSICPETMKKYTRLSHPFFKDEGLEDIRLGMNI